MFTKRLLAAGALIGALSLLPAVPAAAASCIQGAAGCSVATTPQGCSSVDSNCRRPV